jgi:hypothetical protein
MFEIVIFNDVNICKSKFLLFVKQINGKKKEEKRNGKRKTKELEIFKRKLCKNLQTLNKIIITFFLHY